MESRDGKCDPFDGVYSRVSFNLTALRNECIAFLTALLVTPILSHLHPTRLEVY